MWYRAKQPHKFWHATVGKVAGIHAVETTIGVLVSPRCRIPVLGEVHNPRPLSFSEVDVSGSEVRVSGQSAEQGLVPGVTAHRSAADRPVSGVLLTRRPRAVHACS